MSGGFFFVQEYPAKVPIYSNEPAEYWLVADFVSFCLITWGTDGGFGF